MLVALTFDPKRINDPSQGGNMHVRRVISLATGRGLDTCAEAYTTQEIPVLSGLGKVILIRAISAARTLPLPSKQYG